MATTPEKKRGVGRPPKNDPDDVDAIQAKIDAYFDKCEAEESRPGWCGLALALGYCSRGDLWIHATSNEPISRPIKTAMLRIEAVYESMLGISSAAGPIFALKNRGWKDTSDDNGSAQLIAALDAVLDKIGK